MRHFYGVDNLNFDGIAGDGSGQTIAIVDALDDPNAASDLHQFDSYYGLPDPPSFEVLDEYGGNNLPTNDGPGPISWEVEESLDVQWAHVTAPAASIVLIEANSASLNDLLQGVQTAASLPNVVTVSMSWGAPEDQITNETSYDSSFIHSGVTFVAATGDGGSPGDYPAYSPNVLAVGGTTISFAPATTDGTYGSEKAWSNGGGGFSVVEPQPGYQRFIKFGNSRAIPDVSMDADPQTGVAIYDSFDFGSSTPWAQYGGTSLGTPMWAGLITIADQGRASVGLSSLDGSTQTLPALYALPVGDFHDITSGSNGAFVAWAGYDAVTGIGTPVASKLVNDLATVPASPVQVAVNASDGITLMQSPDHLYIDWVAGSINGPVSGRILIGDTSGLIINGDGGNDPILLDDSNGDALPAMLSFQGTFTIYGVPTADPLAGRTMNINQGTLYINYAGGADPIASIRQFIQNGYNGGNWTGGSTAMGVITSSAAQGNPRYMIGYADSADGVVFAQPPNTIELRYTLAGDANLDGHVDSADLQILLTNLNRPGGWDQGDFNYDGRVNSADLQTMLFMLNTSLGNQAAEMTTAAAVDARRQAAAPATTSTNLSHRNVVSAPPVPIAVRRAAPARRYRSPH